MGLPPGASCPARALSVVMLVCVLLRTLPHDFSSVARRVVVNWVRLSRVPSQGWRAGRCPHGQQLSFMVQPQGCENWQATGWRRCFVLV